MNKTILLVSVSSFAFAAIAADVNFNNNVFRLTGTTTIDPVYKVLDASGAALKNLPDGATAYVAQLYVVDGGTRTAIENGLVNFRPSTASDNNAGTWSGRTVSLPGVADGATVTLQIGVWDSLLGSGVDAVFAAGGQSGWSAEFPYTAPAAGDLRPEATYMTNFRGFELNVVPEPSTYALAALGLGGLLFLRRKN